MNILTDTGYDEGVSVLGIVDSTVNPLWAVIALGDTPSIGWQIVGSVLTALLLAVFSFRALMRRQPPHIENGCWHCRLDLPFGGGLLHLYNRAFVAAHGMFALRSPETVYFSAAVDSSGKPLQCGSSYCIRGRDPDTRWWSLTAYKNEHLIPNVLNRYSFSKTTIGRGADGSWQIYLSPRHQSENWLPTGEPNGKLTLLLRLYNPSPAVLSDPVTVELPQILPLEKAS